MKVKNYVLTGVAALSFGTAGLSIPVNAGAATTYRTVPQAIRGYYISKSGKTALAISKKHVIEAYPLADSYTWTVTKANYSNHHYHIHAYIDMGTRTHTILKLNHYSKYRLSSGGYSFQKVSKHNWSKFLNSWEYVRG